VELGHALAGDAVERRDEEEARTASASQGSASTIVASAFDRPTSPLGEETGTRANAAGRSTAVSSVAVITRQVTRVGEDAGTATHRRDENVQPPPTLAFGDGCSTGASGRLASVG
jgi:hypothetical protein